MIASLPSALVAFSLEVVLMGAGTVLGVDRSAARILGGSTSHRKGTPRSVVALIRAGGDVTRYWHWQALHTLGVVLRRGYVNLAQEHQNGHFYCFRSL